MLEHMGAPGANVAAAADGQTALEDQSSLLDHFMANMAELEKPGKRYDYALHQKSIELCETLGPDMADMLETSREMMADVFPLQDGAQLPLPRLMRASTHTADSANSFLAPLDREQG